MTFWLGLAAGLAAGAVVGTVVSLRAARRAREAQRRASRAERLAEVGAMTGGLAHEIRNPLSTIGLNVQLLEEGLQAPTQDERDAALRRVRAVRREVERLRDILENFLRYAGAVHLEPQRVDLARTLEELADFFHPQAEQAGVRLRLDIGAKPVMALADPQLLKQALLNLLLNAVQAMESAPLSEHEQDRRPPELILRLEPADRDAERVRLHVVDTGPGVPPERVEDVFRPYFTTRSGGSGLGLAITRRIVEAHGGSIELRSEPGKGADFVITLPVLLDEEQETATAAQLRPSGAAPGAQR